MLENIQAHSFMVARAAMVIAKELQSAGNRLSVRKVMAGALLHDIGKTLSLRDGRDHCVIGMEICLQHRMGELAPIVAEHVVLRTDDPSGACSEKEIVYYADKRVKHDEIVSLQERLADILDRYGRDKADLCSAIRRNFSRCEALQAKLFRSLPFGPDELARMVRRGDDPFTFHPA